MHHNKNIFTVTHFVPYSFLINISVLKIVIRQTFVNINTNKTNQILYNKVLEILILHFVNYEGPCVRICI
jgi:hypothetical protein